MRSFTLLFLVLFLAGCTVLVPTKNSKEILLEDWKRLKSSLESAPILLQDLLEKEFYTQSKQQHNNYNNQSNHNSNRYNLRVLIAGSQQLELQYDNTFEEAFNLVSNGQQKVSETYTNAMINYLLDPKFYYKKPIYSRYFQHKFSPKNASDSLPNTVPFLVTDYNDGANIRWIDLRRVRSIHFLFAGSGPEMASRFGHVALRLIISPEGVFDDEIANHNLYEHIVLGYMAHIDEFELDTLKALSGDYKAYLFASSFMDAYRNYAISEFREIFSVPLLLTASNRDRIVRELSEIHWSYSGDYNFFTNNCSTLLQKNLRFLIPDFNENIHLKYDYIRPDNFFSAIKETSLVDTEKLEYLDKAEQQGYYFPSTEPFYEKALNAIITTMIKSDFDNIESYLDRFPQERMAEILGDAAYFKLLTSNSYYLTAQIMLEELAMRRDERRLIASGSKYFKNINIDNLNESIKLQLNEDEWELYDNYFLSKIRMITQPIPRLNGIPDQSTNFPKIPRIQDTRKIVDRTKLTEILTRVHPEGQEQWQRIILEAAMLEGTMKNIHILQGLKDEY